MKKGVHLIAHSPSTERMGFALVESLRRTGIEGRIRVDFQDACPAACWDKLGVTVSVSRSVHAGGGDLRWLNKLSAIAEADEDESIFLDSDMLAMRDIGYWWEDLATDDLTFWNARRRPSDIGAETVVTNQLNPHPFCEHYGVEAVPIMLGGGHYFFRNTVRGQAILQRIADIMVEAVENPGALYWKFAGEGNIVGDEPAASMAVVEFGVRLPEPSAMAPQPPVGVFMAPWQRWVKQDFAKSLARYWCTWTKQEVEPDVVHFAHVGKSDPGYAGFVQQRWAGAHISRRLKNKPEGSQKNVRM